MQSLSRAASTAPGRIRRARPLLGTIVEIEVAAERPANELHAAIDAAFEEVSRIHLLMSYQDAASELSRLNRTASTDAQQVDPRTLAVVRAAMQVAELSGGAFDPCVAPRLEELGGLPRAGDRADAHASWRDVELMCGDRVRFARALRLDLGGIAKGFAVDTAFETLQRCGFEDIYVNAGGDLRVAGLHPRGIVLRNPTDPAGSAHRLNLQQGALATSAAYFSRMQYEGKEVSALINGRTRDPYTGPISISVRADTCMAADALTKVVLFADRAVAEHCLAEFN